MEALVPYYGVIDAQVLCIYAVQVLGFNVSRESTEAY